MRCPVMATPYPEGQIQTQIKYFGILKIQKKMFKFGNIRVILKVIPDTMSFALLFLYNEFCLSK